MWHSTVTWMRCIRWNLSMFVWMTLVFDYGVMHVWPDNCLRVSSWLSLGIIIIVRYWMKYFNHQIPENESGNTIHAWTCIERNDLNLWRTVWNWGLFLAHPTYWHKRVTSENAWNSPDVDFESSKCHAKLESWNNPSLHCCAVFPTWQYCLYSLIWWFFVYFVTARANLFTDHKISNLPIRTKYIHFRTVFEHTVDNSPTDSCSSSSLNWWSSMALVVIFPWLQKKYCIRTYLWSVQQYPFWHDSLFENTFRVIRPWRYRFFIKFPSNSGWWFSLTATEILDLNISL